ncbi:MAG: ABC transporter permease, partial [Deltaproteobacteria bacterium]|nr:ABC transporter permease [Deltaproteobacteria bacterium]
MDKASGIVGMFRHKRLAAIIRFGGLIGIALAVFALVLLVFGQNPLRAYADIFKATLGTPYGFSEVLVKMIPLVLTALAVAIPSRIWLINVGGEGQLFIGALFATWGAINFNDLSAWLLLPLISILGFLGGGLWALISGFMRAKGWASETISTLLMNYVAILLVSFFVFGPWKDPESANYPQSAPFPDAAILPFFFGSRVHLGAVLAIVGLLLFYFVMSRTRWGLEMRAMGINQEAARRSGISTYRYILLLMFIGGGMAGLAGMGEVSAIHGQLRPSLSPGLGYTGFLISWITMGSPLGIVAAAFLISIITAGGD